jgi:hypothetical protein
MGGYEMSSKFGEISYCVSRNLDKEFHNTKFCTSFAKFRIAKLCIALFLTAKFRIAKFCITIFLITIFCSHPIKDWGKV